LGGLNAESGKFCVNKTSFAMENLVVEKGGRKTVTPISLIFAVT
jgi:hypothetical protein